MFRDIAKLHLKKGYDVHVVCGSSDDFTEMWKEQFPANTFFSSFNARLDRDGSVLIRVSNLLKLFWMGTKDLVKKKDFQLVYLVSYPPFLAICLLPLIRIFAKQAKAIYYLQDNHIYFTNSSPTKYLFTIHNRLILKHFDHIITLSDSMKTGLLESSIDNKKEKARSRIHVIPNYSVENPSTENHPEIRKNIDIIYAGNHGLAQNLYYFIDLISQLELSENPKIMFFGDGTEKASLIKHAKSRDCPIIFQDSIPRDEVSKKIAASRFGLVAAQPRLTNYAHPSKLAAYNSAGTKALLMCEPESEIASWLQSNNLGYPIDSASKEIATRQIMNALASPMYDMKHVRDVANKIYSKEKYIDKFENFIDTIAN